MEIPDELYRMVKAKSALEGRPVREVAVELFRRYVSDEDVGEPSARQVALVDGKPAPSWFGSLRAAARPTENHDLESIRRSIARGQAAERGH